MSGPQGEVPRTSQGFDRDGVSRLLGSRDGILHALCLVESFIARYHGPYRGNFPPRHVRKIKQRDAIVGPMREIAAILDRDMRECLLAYQKNHDELEAATSKASSVSSTHPLKQEL